MTRDDPSTLWAELDRLGENEVRARVARRRFGPRDLPLVDEWLQRRVSERLEQERRDARKQNDADLRLKQRANAAGWVAAAVSFAALLIAAASFLFSYKTYKEAHSEPLLLRVSRWHGDYATSLDSSHIPPLGPALLPTYWEVILVNNGQQTMSVVDVGISLLTPSGEVMYTGLVDAILDDHLRPISPPWSLDPGKPIRLYARLRLPTSPIALTRLRAVYPDGRIPSLRRAEMILASHGIDFFGDSLTPIRSDSRTVGFSVANSAQQPSVAVRIKTGRGTSVVDIAFWYPSPQP